MASKDEDVAAGCGLGATALVLILGFCGVFVGCNNTYSDGYRDGYIQKFSSKGFIVKSWEGELAIAGLVNRGKGVQGSWEFSVADEKITKELQEVEPDELIRIHYRQVWLNASFWYATSYRAIRIERLDKEHKARR